MNPPDWRQVLKDVLKRHEDHDYYKPPEEIAEAYYALEAEVRVELEVLYEVQREQSGLERLARHEKLVDANIADWNKTRTDAGLRAMEREWFLRRLDQRGQH